MAPRVAATSMIVRSEDRSNSGKFRKQILLLLVVVLVALNLTRQKTTLSVFLNLNAETIYQVQVNGKNVIYPQGPVTRKATVPAVWNPGTLLEGTIRKWGCHRNETPLWFVHIGKAGGGNARARFAAAALNFQRDDWFSPRRDSHYYPVSPHHNASFCSSAVFSMGFPVNGTVTKGYEGTYECVATTPIGSAMGCPDLKLSSNRCLGCQDMNSRYCPMVYAGHNLLGSEMNFLPPRYLDDWWEKTPWARHFPIDWLSLRIGNTSWCQPPGFARPIGPQSYHKLFETCQVPIAKRIDQEFEAYWTTVGGSSGRMLNYAPIYASLPLHRVVLLREPFSWLLSKYSWHNVFKRNVTCDDIVMSSKPPPAMGWAYKFSLLYIHYLCGQDCSIRWDQGRMTVEEMEMQATMNLRQSFSVVGLLQESDTFYSMVSTRIGYVNMSLNPHVQGKSHKSRKGTEIQRCAERFADAEVRARFISELPLLGVLVRLYNVGVEVNRFQMQELTECSGSKLHQS